MTRSGQGGGASIDYDQARALIERVFAEVEDSTAESLEQSVASASEAGDRLFSGRVQSYREALLGCALIRVIDPTLDIRLPYVAHGDRAYNGRTLDERVINPFLKAHNIPSSKGPYLAAFRRSVRFVPATGEGLRDRAGYEAMLDWIAILESAAPDRAESLLRDLCFRFARLRDRSRVPLVRLIRMSLDQQAAVISGLLVTRSGGRFPVFFIAAMLEALRDRFVLPWDISVQGINTADAATGAGGDIEVHDRETGAIVMAIEVTERPIDRNRVVSTFTSKIAADRIPEYMFLYTNAEPDAEARKAAFSYFAQGHDILFLRVESWVYNCLGMVGASGREAFIRRFLDRLNSQEVPSALKQRWNELANIVAAGLS